MTTKAIEVLCTRWAKMADGGVSIGLRIHFDDAGAVGDMKPNRRYAASFVEIGDDELPVKQPQEVPAQNTQQNDRSKQMTGFATSHSVAMDGDAVASASGTNRPSKSDPKNRLIWQAVKACKQPWFRLFLEERRANLIPADCHVNTEKDARDIVCFECEITSRREIIIGSEAATRWNRLYSEAIAWQHVPEWVS